MSALVLLSGGMDSVVCMAMAEETAKREGSTVVCLHLNYHQKTSSRELKAFQDVCDHYQIPQKDRVVVEMDFLKKIGSSSLTDDSMSISEFQNTVTETMPTSYVPFRNSIILSLATALAETRKLKDLYIGANWEDSPGYPDCRPEFYQAFEKVISLGTADAHLKIQTPLIHLKKKDIVAKGLLLGAPFHLSWSCYAREDRPCGVCDSCALRARGFREARIKDPIITT
jgi:7-cyano-7-deazaguanine synthase